MEKLFSFCLQTESEIGKTVWFCHNTITPTTGYPQRKAESYLV
ncbi:hypothetical protein NC651_015770 [Populus alba x Populus x berolinensis]|nr:hypothetical protein NC651_015770 [Populus alba x Populus x berolinensis]